MNQKETSSVNTSHQQQQQQNKEESKLKTLLQGSYDYIHKETGKMIQKKLYKRAFQLLEKFYTTRKDLELGEMVMLNRRIINCINKILQQGLLKPDIEQDRPEIMIQIFNRGTQALFESYKYINLFVQKVMPNEMKGVVLEEVSHLTSSDEEDEERIKEHEVTVLFYKINEYEKPKKERTKKQTKELNPYEQEVSESSRIANMIGKTIKPLNIQFELDQYFYNLIILQLMANLIFKKANKPKVAYYYLIEADRISKQILDTPNPNLVNVCARVKVYLANYYYEISEYAESLKQAEQAIVILCGEMRIRINQEKFVQKKHKNRERRRMKRCVITTLSALITMMCDYEAQNNYHRIVETLTTASWLGEKYIQGIDEFKKHIIKLASEGRHRLEQNLRDLADLSFIAESVLDQELHKIRKKQRDQREQSESDYLKKFNSDMFNLFQIKPLNEQLYFRTQIKEEQKTKQQFDNKIIEQSQPHGTDASINIFDSDSESKDSFFDGSFFAPSIDNLQFDSKLFDEKRPQSVARKQNHRKVLKSSRQKGKSVGLIKIGLERPQDYKSKILTTTQYFNEYQKPKTQEEKHVSNTGALLKRQLENLEYREHPDRDEHHKQDLDVYVGKMVNGKIQTNEIRDYNEIQGQLFNLRKKEDFDKKEFQFGRRMLNLKSKEEIMFYKESFKTPPVKVEIDTKVKDQAHIIDGKINAERDLKDLKRRKIDKMVAGKKIVQTNVNIDLKDPEETNYLKKVLEKSKKKKLKDLIYKHRESLGLSKFFANLLREQKEKERILKLKSAMEKEISVDVQDNQSQQQLQVKQRKNVKIVINQADKPTQQVSLQPSQIQVSQSNIDDPKLQGQPILLQQKSNSQTNLPKTILKRPKDVSSVKESPQVSQTIINFEAQGTELLLQQEKQQKAKKAAKEQIDKQQKKSHQVIGMIIDAVERKLDTENKELKKMLFKQKGGSKQYVDDDERTYLKFMPKFADMSRSTYLMYIKKELADKQVFSFEDVAMLRANVSKKTQLSDVAQLFKDLGGHS